MTRAAKATISLPIAQAIVMAHVHRHLEENDNEDLRSFHCGQFWMRRFLQGELDWSYCSVTCAVQKLPEKWELFCKQLHAHLYYTIKMHGVDHPDFVLNVDQLGFLLIPSGKKTWHPRGEKQVSGHGHDAKKQVRVPRHTMPLTHVFPEHTCVHVNGIWSCPASARHLGSTLR